MRHQVSLTGDTGLDRLVPAAMVPVDRTPSELLAWLAATNEYHRLLAGGVTPQTAARVAAELAGAAA